MITTPGRLGGMAQFPKGVEVASFRNYEQAVRAVSKLGQEGIEIATVSIVGSGLYVVEKVVGKITPGKMALQGAGQGLTWGLLLGLMLMIFQPAVSIIWIGACIVIGVCFGVLLSAISLLGSGKRRQYMARSQIMASRYALLISAQADRAFQILQGFPGNLGPGGQSDGMPIRSARATMNNNVGYGSSFSHPDGPGTNPGSGGSESSQRFGAPSEKSPNAGAQGADLGANSQTVANTVGGQENSATTSQNLEAKNLPPTEFGSRPDEQPKFGVRLSPEERQQRQAQQNPQTTEPEPEH